MKYIKKLGALNIFMLFICLIVIIFAEYFFLTGERLHGIFVGLWAPVIIGLLIFFNIVFNGDR